MDNETIVRQFEEIEKKVEKLIEKCKSFEETNLDLKNKNERLEKELQEKIEEKDRYFMERDLIREKIDTLLTRLEGTSVSVS